MGDGRGSSRFEYLGGRNPTRHPRRNVVIVVVNSETRNVFSIPVLDLEYPGMSMVQVVLFPLLPRPLPPPSPIRPVISPLAGFGPHTHHHDLQTHLDLPKVYTPPDHLRRCRGTPLLPDRMQLYPSHSEPGAKTRARAAPGRSPYTTREHLGRHLGCDFHHQKAPSLDVLSVQTFSSICLLACYAPPSSSSAPFTAKNMKYKKPHSWYNLYCNDGVLHCQWISRCSDPAA